MSDKVTKLLNVTSASLAVDWLRAIRTWLLETDNDMKLPSGVLDMDPLDLADALAATEAESKAREAELREAATAARNRIRSLEATAIADGKTELAQKFEGWANDLSTALANLKGEAA